MKNIVTYHLLVMVLFAFHYKTIKQCFEFAGTDSTYTQDYDCEKEGSESNKTNEKNEKEEKKEIWECYHFDKSHALTTLLQLSYIKATKALFTNSDYSMAVYSPPETSAI